MKTIYELIDFVNHCNSAGIDLPDNLFIHSPEIIQEAHEFASVGDGAITTDAGGIKIYGIRVVRDFAEFIN